MSVYSNRYGTTPGFSSRSHGSLSGRPSVYRMSTGFQPATQRSTSGLNLVRVTPTSSALLLASMPSVEMDPKVHQIRNQEKEQIKVLNNQFVNFIDKVRELEKENKVLDTQLRLLKEKDVYKSNMDQITQATGNNLKQQIDGLLHEKDKLKSELQNVQAVLDDYKNRYEDELNRRNHLENDFVVTKKDLDDTYLQKVDKESKMGSLANEIDCLKKLYDEELKELQSQVHNGKVTVEMNNSRDLEMKHIMDGVKAQYQAVADKSRQEADQWYKNKVDDMENQAKRNNEELKALKNDVNELNRMIQRANADNDALKNQRANLESAISLAEEHGEEAARNAKSHIQDLEDAIKKAKQDMARKVKEYQDLMNIKLALDIEIATYRKLLEGEEGRMHDQGITANPVMAVQSMPIEKLASTLNFNVQSSPPVLKSPTPKKLVLVKTIETANGRNFSETTNFSRE